MPGVSSTLVPRSVGANRQLPEAVLPGVIGESLRGKGRRTSPRKTWNTESIEAVARQRASQAAAIAKRTNTPIAWARAMHAAIVVKDADVAVQAASKVIEGLNGLRHARADKALIESAGDTLLKFGDHEHLRDLLDALRKSRPELVSPRLEALVRANDGDYAAALEILRTEESLDALGQRAYLELRLGMPQEAVRHLRQLLDTGRPRPEDLMNLAVAYWELGSLRKAARTSREAVRMAPGRKDVSLDSMRLLLGYGALGVVQSEIEGLKARGVDDPDLLKLEVELLEAKDESSEALNRVRRLLRRADLSEELGAECEALRAVLEARLDVISRREGFRQIEGVCSLHGPTASMVDWLVELGDSPHDGARAMVLFERVKDRFTENYRIRLESQLAYLTCDFERALLKAEILLRREPDNEFAVGTVSMLAGHLREDWGRGCALVTRLRKRGLVESSYMVNQAAFVLASAGQGSDALSILASHEEPDYYLLATRGLAQMAAGDFAAGAKDYRDAFAAVPKGSRQATVRALMAVFQAQAINRLDIRGGVDELEIVGSSLPVSEIRELENTDATFALLRLCAQRNGWEWPTLI